MKFSIVRDQLLKPLQFVNGVVEKRQTLPILGNVLLTAHDDHRLEFTGTDLEVELTAYSDAANVERAGAVTVPARKFFDICRSFSDNNEIKIQLDGSKLLITSGASRFSLATLPASDFPKTKDGDTGSAIEVEITELKKLLERTQFAMAQQDVRYYLNGCLWQIEGGALTAVATDGHRLSLCRIPVQQQSPEIAKKVIVPRKAIYEIGRLLADNDGTIKIVLSSNHINLQSSSFILSSKLIDGRYPDFQNVIPRANPYKLVVTRDELKPVLARVAILANEKYRGIRFILDENKLTVAANNPEHEEAEEALVVSFPNQHVEMALNVNYVIEMLNSLPTGNLNFSISGPEKSILVELENDELNALNVIMPLRL
jgi:DNA polymerase-3 subunit beta